MEREINEKEIKLQRENIVVGGIPKDEYYTKVEVDGLLDEKQDELISGTNIKTLNNESLLGTGNITITTEETDPIFSNSPSSNITNNDITNWNNKSDFSGDYEDLSNKPTIPSKTSDLTNDSGYIDGLVMLTYGTSTWQDFQNAYNKNKVVYCSVNGRMAFMAYVSSNNVEFQYYRSITTHTDSQQGDQVFVYKLSNNNSWSTETREATTKITTSTGLEKNYDSGTLTLSVDNTIATKTYVDNSSIATITTNTNIWDLAQGVYKVDAGIQLSYKTNGYLTTGNYGCILFVSETANSRTPFYFMGRGTLSTETNSNHIIIGIAQDSTYGIYDKYDMSEMLRVVHTINDQTINGVKTFNSLPVSSAVPSNDNQLVNKAYVDGLVGNINTVLSTLTTVGGGN